MAKTVFSAGTQIKSAEVNANFDGAYDGSLDTDHNSLQKFRDEAFYDYAVSGLVWSGDSYGVNRNASMTSGVVTVDGYRMDLSAVSSRTFTASRDTYIDVLRTGSSASLVYTEVTNNNTSPALASNSIRIGIIVTGASTIANVGSVNQGQVDKVLPIASSIPYAVTDSLGNLICNRSAYPGVIGYRQIVSTFSANTGAGGITSYTDVTGLSVPFIVPANRRIKVTLWAQAIESSLGSPPLIAFTLRESTTVLAESQNGDGAASSRGHLATEYVANPSTGSHTYKASIASNQSSPTMQVFAASTSPAFVKVELV